MKKTFFSAFCMLLLMNSCMNNTDKYIRPRIDLSGKWAFRMDSVSAYSDSLLLPGTTDTNKKGIKNEKMDETTYLSRTYSYSGKVWYQKTVTVPENWKDKNINLFMERTKPTQVWVDNKPVGSNTDISVPQTYDLSEVLSPGEHTITIMVDNGASVPKQVITSSHAYTESTQTNWNGVIGKFYIEAVDKCHIKNVQVYPDYDAKKALVKVEFSGIESADAPAIIKCEAETWNTDKKQSIKIEQKLEKISSNVCELMLDLGENAATWSEFDPALYRFNVSLSCGNMSDSKSVNFGLRKFETKGTQFSINDMTTFLRGKHDACVFPLTAHVAMDVDSWRHYFRVAKEYGINHYRFHSWCPPEACFEAADIEGIYLQPELPFWGGLNSKDSVLISFLRKEGVAIQNEYSNHASFVMFALGNEISGEDAVLRDLIGTFRRIEDRHMYAYGSNNSLGFKGQQEGEDFLVTCRVGQESDTSFVTHARASFSFADAYDGGYMNHTYPNTRMNFSGAVSRSTVPVIGHETGQYQVYPNYKEMDKYTGVLEPRNFAVFKKRLEDAGMGGQAEDFFKASGRWAAELYRADIEMNLRTEGMGGFQLLDLQDYPGQGSAFVGILDAFMDSKGLIKPEEWRQFCNEVVPLIKMSSYTYSSDKPFEGEIYIANYSNASLVGDLEWKLSGSDGRTLVAGNEKIDIAQGKLGFVKKLSVDLSSVAKAEKCMLSLKVGNTEYENSYPVWVYPAKQDLSHSQDIVVTDKLDASLKQQLKEGKKVLYFPNLKKYEKSTVGGLFQTDYWNYRMFRTICENIKKPVSPGTMGLLMNPEHSLFTEFPTEYHTNWQWFPIIKSSRPLILDNMPSEYKPIIQVIDNIERNHKLGLLFEFKVGEGKLLVCMSDILSVQDKPEARQFYYALLKYMDSDSFNPSFTVDVNELDQLFEYNGRKNSIQSLRNISYDTD